MLEQLITGLRWVHIPAGLLGLAVFWLPLVTRKGGTAHRRIGWVFVWCMGVAAVTAAALAAVRWWMARDAALAEGRALTVREIAGPLFLINVAALTLTAVHHGLAVLRQKKREGRHRGLLVIALPAALLLLSAVSVAVGVASGNPVLFTLPVVGLFVGSQYLVIMLRARPRSMWWWYQHMSGMIGGCIAALTAALVQNGPAVRSVVAAPGWVLWIAPAAVGLPALLVWQAVYRRRFGGGGARAVGEAG